MNRLGHHQIEFALKLRKRIMAAERLRSIMMAQLTRVLREFEPQQMLAYAKETKEKRRTA